MPDFEGARGDAYYPFGEARLKPSRPISPGAAKAAATACAPAPVLARRRFARAAATLDS
jgi:hypothetical protein